MTSEKSFAKKWLGPEENERRTAILVLRQYKWSKELIAKHLHMHPIECGKVFRAWAKLDRTNW